MLRHVVLFRFKPDTTEAARQALRKGLAAIPSTISEVRAYVYGDDLQMVSGNFDFAVVADFDDRHDFQTYAGHPKHQQLITDLIRPVVAERVAVQFEY